MDYFNTYKIYTNIFASDKQFLCLFPLLEFPRKYYNSLDEWFEMSAVVVTSLGLVTGRTAILPSEYISLR